MLVESTRRWHGCAVVHSAEQGWETLSDFVQEGVRRGQRVMVGGLRLDQRTDLLRRISEDGPDPDELMADGRLMVMPEEASLQLAALPAADLTQMIADQVDQALADGHRGLRLGGIHPGVGIGPFEAALDELIESVPLDVLCAYHRSALTFDELHTVRAVHTDEVPDDAEYDDGMLRITRPRQGWVRLAGRWERRNHEAALKVVSDAAAAGHRNVDTSSLRYVDPVGLHAMLTGISGGLRLQRPNHLVQQLAGLLAKKPVADATPAVADVAQ